jgi:hypothetical protein
LLAISRCFAGSIAANPRFDPPLLLVGMTDLPLPFRRPRNAIAAPRFNMLMEVRNNGRVPM